MVDNWFLKRESTFPILKQPERTQNLNTNPKIHWLHFQNWSTSANFMLAKLESDYRACLTTIQKGLWLG